MGGIVRAEVPINLGEKHMRLKHVLASMVVPGLMAGCGGGGGSSDGGGSLAEGSAACTVTMANPMACHAVMSLALIDSAGAAASLLSPTSPGTLVATIKDASGKGVANTVVSFKTDDTVALLTSSRTATTDANGVARLALPAGTQAGSFTAEATATVNGSAMRATVPYGVSFPVLTVTLQDASGVPLSEVTPDTNGKLVASLKYPDASGQAVPNTVVTFDAKGVTVDPASATVLTDASGRASVSVRAGSLSGGFTAEAKTSVNGATLRSAVNYSVGFPTLTLDPFVAVPSTLSASGTASISVMVMNNGRPYLRPVQVAFSSPCTTTGKSTMTPLVTTKDGLATATYTDKGCATTDSVTATVTVGDKVVARTSPLVVRTAAAGAIQFLSADTTNIALAGTGGSLRRESAQLKFKVLDVKGNPVSGVDVNFAFSNARLNDTATSGGLQLLPASATSDADGLVSTWVYGGSNPTPVQVVASAGDVTTASNSLVVSTGVGDQAHFSLSTSVGNCEGKDFAQVCSTVTASMADHFGNPVPDGTVVLFSAEGGIIDASCLTGTLPAGSAPVSQSTDAKVGPGSGSCSVTLRSARPRPVNGRVTVLAYAMGEETFFDDNGNGRCDDCAGLVGKEFTPAFDKSPDIFRDDDENNVFTVGEQCVSPSNNSMCNTPADGEYNGVLRTPQTPASRQAIYVSDQLVQLFSGSNANIGFLNSGGLVCPAGGSVGVQFTVKDDNGNPMPAKTLIELSTMFGASAGQVTPANVVVANYALKVRDPSPEPVYRAIVGCPVATSGMLFVKVTTPNNVVTNATVRIN